MISTEYVKMMSAYTEWQNRSIYAAADGLGDEERVRDRGAFFGSIHATLSHLLWGDQLWMHRLAGTRKPSAADIATSVSWREDWEALKADRLATDRALIDWSGRVSTADLAGNLSWYPAISRAEVHRPRWALIVQLFNHGTHHRGQVHAMLTAAGAKLDDTDVQYLRSEHFPWPSR